MISRNAHTILLITVFSFIQLWAGDEAGGETNDSRSQESSSHAISHLSIREQTFFRACGSGNDQAVESTLKFVSAASNYDKEKVKIFVNTKDSNGQTPLHYAAARIFNQDNSTANYKKVINLLSLAGADMYAEDNNGKTALDLVINDSTPQQDDLRASIIMEIQKTDGTKEAEAQSYYRCAIL